MRKLAIAALSTVFLCSCNAAKQNATPQQPEQYIPIAESWVVSVANSSAPLTGWTFQSQTVNTRTIPVDTCVTDFTNLMSPNTMALPSSTPNIFDSCALQTDIQFHASNRTLFTSSPARPINRAAIQVVKEVVLIDPPAAPHAPIAALSAETCEVCEQNPPHLLNLQPQEILDGRDHRCYRSFHKFESIAFRHSGVGLHKQKRVLVAVLKSAVPDPYIDIIGVAHEIYDPEMSGGLQWR